MTDRKTIERNNTVKDLSKLLQWQKLRQLEGQWKVVPPHGVDRDSGGESGRRAWAGRDILFLCLSQLKPCVPIHLHYPDPPHVTVPFFEHISDQVYTRSILNYLNDLFQPLKQWPCKLI